MPWKVCFFLKIRLLPVFDLVEGRKWTVVLQISAGWNQGCVPLESQRIQAKICGMLSGKRLMTVRLTGCRENWTPALSKSDILMEVKWMLACVLVEKDSTSCETVLIKWKLNAKHKMPTFYHQKVAGSPSLFFLVNWSSSNQTRRSHLFTWPNTKSVSNIK